MNAQIIAYLIFGFFILLGVLLSGIFVKKRKVDLSNQLNISDLEQSMMNLEYEANNSLASKHSNENRTWAEKKTLMLEQSHTNISFTLYMSIMAAAMVALFILGYILFKSPIFGFIAALAGYLVPDMFVQSKVKKNIADFNANLVKALRRMASNLRAGGTLKQAIMDVGKSNSMPPAIRSEFINVLSDMEYGSSIEEALYSLYDRTGADDVKTLALTIEIQRRTGGNLAEALDNLARVINKRELQEADIKATLAQAKSSSTIVSIMPFCLTLLLNIISPTYFDEFYAWGDGLGRIIAFLLYAFIVVGMVVINKMSDIKC